MHFFFSIDLPSFFVPSLSLSPRGRGRVRVCAFVCPSASFFAKEVRVFKVKSLTQKSARVLKENDENFFQFNSLQIPKKKRRTQRETERESRIKRNRERF